MGAKAREFIDYWVQNSVHAAEPSGAPGSEQGTAELARRCIEMAASLGISQGDLEAEIGDVEAYITQKLSAANKEEGRRTNRKT